MNQMHCHIQPYYSDSFRVLSGLLREILPIFPSNYGIIEIINKKESFFPIGFRISGCILLGRKCIFWLGHAEIHLA